MPNQETAVTLSIADQWKAFREWAVKPDFMDIPSAPPHPDFSGEEPATDAVREAYFKARVESFEEARASGLPYLAVPDEACGLLTTNKSKCLVTYIGRGYSVFVN